MPRSAVYSLRHLQGIVALCRCRNFGTAAREIGLTQSALTQAVSSIERRLNRRLFDRGHRGVRPTKAAERLSAGIQRAIDLLNTAGRDALPPSPHRPPLVRRASATQLLALDAVVRAGSFRQAARDYGLSMASIHRAVRTLEAAVDAKLLHRTPAGVQAMPAAVHLCEAVRRAIAELEAGFTAVRSGTTTELVLGATPTLRAGRLSSAIAEIRRRDPTLRFRIEEATWPELIAGLLDGKFDLLLCPLHSKVPEGVLQHRIFDESLSIVARSDHPLLKARGATSATALTQYPWITNPPETPRRTLWEALFRTNGIDPPVPWVECKSFEVVRELLLKTDALALLTPEQYRIERESGLLSAVRGIAPEQTREIVITTRASWIPEATESLLTDLLRSHI
jgi:DNA-binding transcriptional LysR family regulator